MWSDHAMPCTSWVVIRRMGPWQRLHLRTKHDTLIVVGFGVSSWQHHCDRLSIFANQQSHDCKWQGHTPIIVKHR